MKHLNATYATKLPCIVPPVIFAQCCKSIIGCQICIDTWYRGDDGITQKCPLCGTGHALPETMRQHGLDDFLHAIKPILGDPQAACQDEINTERTSTELINYNYMAWLIKINKTLLQY